MSGLLIVIVALLIIVGIDEWELHSLKSVVATYKQQINTLKLDSEQQAKNAKLAYEAAQTQMKQIRDETQTILNTKVSSNCEGSIKWLTQQARSL